MIWQIIAQDPKLIVDDQSQKQDPNLFRFNTFSAPKIAQDQKLDLFSSDIDEDLKYVSTKSQEVDHGQKLLRITLNSIRTKI